MRCKRKNLHTEITVQAFLSIYPSVDQGIVGCTPGPTYPYGKSLSKPYITWVFMGSRRIPRLNTLNTMVAHVRERGTANLREFPGTPRNGTTSHTTPINSWKFMGSLWEPYGKGVPFLGAPGNSLESNRNLRTSNSDWKIYLPLPINFFAIHVVIYVLVLWEYVG